MLLLVLLDHRLKDTDGVQHSVQTASIGLIPNQHLRTPAPRVTKAHELARSNSKNYRRLGRIPHRFADAAFAWSHSPPKIARAERRVASPNTAGMLLYLQTGDPLDRKDRMVQNRSSVAVLDPTPSPVVSALSRAVAIPSAVVFDKVSFAFDDHVVLRDVSFSVPKGSMRILMGPSGAGKSVVLKLVLGLLQPDSGSILINDRHIENMTEQDLMDVRADIGMMFQENALFDSLTVAENVGYRLYEETDMPLDQVRRRVEEVLGFVGLKDYIDTVPSELSGGQRRRVAVARAMAAKPSLLLFDDPTSGLDPITAATIDEQIVKLRDLEHVTSIVVTHQMRDAFYVASHEAARSTAGGEVRAAQTRATHVSFMVLHEGRIRFDGNAEELRASKDAYLQEFLYKTLPPW